MSFRAHILIQRHQCGFNVYSFVLGNSYHWSGAVLDAEGRNAVGPCVLGIPFCGWVAGWGTACKYEEERRRDKL